MKRACTNRATPEFSAHAQAEEGWFRDCQKWHGARDALPWSSTATVSTVTGVRRHEALVDLGVVTDIFAGVPGVACAA